MLKLIILIIAGLSCISFAEREPMETVDYVDANRYAGRWYQIANNPMFFEPKNCMCTQQTLKLKEDGSLSVFNSCNAGGTPEGKLKTISGSAKNVNPETNAKFKVNFGWFRIGKYWIIGLADNYSWAVVSDPKRKSLYILSKTPDMKEKDYNDALAAAEEQISTSKLIVTDHTACQYPN